MNPDLWSSRRWTESSRPYSPSDGHGNSNNAHQHDAYQQLGSRPSPHAPRLDGPPVSGSNAMIDPITNSSFPSKRCTPANDAGVGVSCETDPRMRHLPEPYHTTSESTFPPAAAVPPAVPQDERYLHYSHAPGRGNRYSSVPDQPTTDISRRETTTPWRESLHHPDHRLSASTAADAAPQLTIHIPSSRDLPRIPTSQQSMVHSEQPYYNLTSSSTASNSLPSFAALREQSARLEDADGPEIAPMSERLSCYNCSRLIPLVKEVTAAVLELDENVQSYCNKSGAKINDAPKDDSFLAVQWIIDRLRAAKGDLQDAARRNYGYFYQHQQNAAPGGNFRNVTPPNPLKRPGEQWERDDFIKRPRSGEPNDYHFQLPALTPRDERRPSVDFAAREHRFALSPPPGGSVPSSARPTSPTYTHRLNTRALPSPSSMAYPPSAGPSLGPQAASVGSPATSYQPTSSIHTASTSSATSAHIADLQHQVTLKSLALQTLQSEYASLLQKLQRERVKSQTIEKKTSVADQEVNDLTGKNEELTEQVKTLESALEESEKKRDALGAEAAREKEQWGRMLDMSGRLHAKVDSERARLLEEKATLERQVTLLREENPSSERPSGDSEILSQKAATTLASTSPEAGGAQSESEIHLKREISRLSGQLESFRSAFARVKRINEELLEHTQAAVERSKISSELIDATLNGDDGRSHQNPGASTGAASAAPPASASAVPVSQSTPSAGQPQSVPASTLPPPPKPASNPLTITKLSKSPQKSGTLQVFDQGKRITAKIADVARAVSPGPEELGFHVVPTTLGPNELIKALGPVPTPPPPFNFSPHATAPGAPRPDLLDRYRQMAASPSHSLPAETTDHVSSGNASPEAYASDPEVSAHQSEKAGLHSYPAVPPIPSHHQVKQRASHFPAAFQNWRPTMSPPSRLDSAHSLPRTTW